MNEVVESIEVARPPEDVFAYATDFARFPEWQTGVVSARPYEDAPPALGSKAAISRRAGPRTLKRTEQITAFEPPRRWTVHGTGGPLTAVAKGSIEPLADGIRSRVTIALEFEAHGSGSVLIPLVRRQARKQLPKNMQQLKQRLEQSHLARAS
jgi:uncharacterized protein YndB with AHSA1/START domain